MLALDSSMELLKVWNMFPIPGSAVGQKRFFVHSNIAS